MDFKFSEDNFFQVINLMSVNSEISKKKKNIIDDGNWRFH